MGPAAGSTEQAASMAAKAAPVATPKILVSPEKRITPRIDSNVLLT
jgi:hypothetical protein